jgi:hypothetical protein
LMGGCFGLPILLRGLQLPPEDPRERERREARTLAAGRLSVRSQCGAAGRQLGPGARPGGPGARAGPFSASRPRHKKA